MEKGIEFFTATVLNWQNLLTNTVHKAIIVDSLRYLCNDNRIWVYGFVIMPNHIHALWRKQDAWLIKSVEQMFLKYTAQQIKFNLIANHPQELKNYKSTQTDRFYHFWERRTYKSTMYTREILEQKLEYIH
jgi:putative transposase